MRSNSFEIDGGCDDLDIGQGELRALSEDDAIESNHTGTIVVETITVASLLIGVEVDTTELMSEWFTQGAYLHCSFFDEVYAAVKLSKLVVASRRVCKDFNTVQAHEDMRPEVNE